MSQSTNFQSSRVGATASCVNKRCLRPDMYQYFRGVKCLAKGHNLEEVGFEPPTSRSGVRHSTTEPLQSSWQNSGRKSKVDGFVKVLRFPTPRKTTWVRQHPRLQECAYKLNGLSE